MSSRDAAHSTVTPAAVASALPFDRMAALGKWIAAKAEEMHQLDGRIERRLEHLQRSEESLRTLCESVRQQVVAAQEATEEFTAAQRAAAEERASAERFAAERLSTEKDTAAFERQEFEHHESEHQSSRFDSLQDALGVAAMVADTLDAKSTQLQKTADLIVQSTADRLDALFEQAYQLRTKAVHDEFELRSTTLVESVRQSSIEQIERLGTQVSVAVEPILARIARQQDQAATQLRTSLEIAEQTLQRRADQLARAGDASVDALEQRLARRVENVRPRVEDAIGAAEHDMRNRVAAVIETARKSISTAQEDLQLQAAQLRPRLSGLLQQSDDDLVEHLARLEAHAFAMTGWLEQRMSDRVDALIDRTRTALTSTVPPALSDAASERVLYTDEYGCPTPKLELSIFIDNKTATRTPRQYSKSA